MLAVKFTKKHARTVLSCRRPDGSTTSADLGPLLPYHDLAHYVVESTLELQRGFFGNVSAGFAIASLGDKQTIRTLGSDSLIAEVLARALTSLQTGACNKEEFAELVNAELAQFKIAAVAGLSPETVEQMSNELRRLTSQFEALAPGDSMVLEFTS
jgi:hypothetical protein